MIKKITALLVAALTIGVASAENKISLSAAQGHPGEEVTVSMVMSGTDAVAAIDMKLPLPEAVTYVTGSAALTDRCKGHQVSASTVDGVLRLVVYTLSLSDISGTQGDVLSFKLQLGNKPLTAALEPTVVLGNAQGTSLGASVTSGEVTILCPELTIDTPAIDFGHVPIRSEYNENLVLRNSGNEPLTITSLTSDNATVSVAGGGEVIAPGATQQYTVTFSPDKRGEYASSIAVDCDAVNRLVYGRLQKAQVVADPFSVNELHVEAAEGNSGEVVTVNLRMNNMEPITGLQATISLPEGIDYVDGSAKLSERAADHKITGTLQGRDLTLLMYSASNSPVADEDGTVASFDVVLNARSGWYYLWPENVKLANATAENMTSATDGNFVSVRSPHIEGDDSFDLGDGDVTKEMTATYHVQNQGDAQLVIERVSFLADGFGVKTPLPLTVEPWEEAMLEISYMGTKPGAFKTTMNIYSNDPEMRLKPVALSGNAYSPNSLSVSGSYAADKGYEIEVSMDNHAEITALQFDLMVDIAEALGGDPTITTTVRMVGFNTMASKIGEGHFRILAYVLSDKAIAGNSGEVMTLRLAGGSVVPEALNVTLQGIVLSSADSKNMLWPDDTATCVISTVERGDANGDGKCSIADVTSIVNYLNGNSTANFSPYGADANSDGTITIGDVTTVINKLLQ